MSIFDYIDDKTEDMSDLELAWAIVQGDELLPEGITMTRTETKLILADSYGDRVAIRL